jgi:hypothetical protein
MSESFPTLPSPSQASGEGLHKPVPTPFRGMGFLHPPRPTPSLSHSRLGRDGLAAGRPQTRGRLELPHSTREERNP